MATKKIIIKQKTAEGYDTLHPQTEWAQIVDAPPIPSGGGGVELFEIVATLSGNTWSLSKTYNEIVTAIDAGKICVVLYHYYDNDSNFYELYALFEYTDNDITFAYLKENLYLLHIATDNSVTRELIEIPAAQVNSDWNASSGKAQILNKPTIPSKTSDLTNDAGFLTQHQDISGKVDKETGKGLSTNDYTTTEKNKLSGIAAGAEVNVQSDWNQSDSTKDDYVKNKPTIPDAQIQSDWNQSDNTKKDFIKNKPSIPTVNNSTITFTQGGVTKGSITLNQSTAETIALDAGGGSKLVQVDMIAYDVNSGYMYSGITLTDGLVVFNIYDSLLYEYDQTNTQWQVSATELNDGDLIYSRLEDACYIFNADDSKLKAVSSGKSLMELVSHDSLDWFKVNLPECNSRSVFEITSANSLVSAYDVEIYTLAKDWETELGSATGSFHNIILKNTKSTDVTFTVVDNSWQDGGNSCEGVISSGLDSNNSFTVKANDFVEISIYISDFTVDGYTGVPIIIVKDGYQSNVTETPI